MRKYFLLVLLALPILAVAQRPQLTIHKTDNAPKIDGVLDDMVWAKAVEIGNFTEFSPEPNTPSDQKTIVKIAYDDEALYIGAMLFDNEPTQIQRELSVRDVVDANNDKFHILIDGFNTGQNAFGFGVTAAGVQIDVQYGIEDQDFGWDSVWKSATAITDEGWVAEFKIPYAVLRFPKKDVQSWGVNFYREIRRTREQSTWSTIDPNQNTQLTQTGIINGINNINPPLRLSATPYVASYATKEVSTDWETSITGGMDVKYGINESFTLDMALIPDFGQVQSDNVQLNLGPFEQRFDENRPFFTEGTELFNRANIFYSRRVGSMPTKYYDVYNTLAENETVLENPEQTQLYNATKLSGRTQGGLGIGLFNAVTGDMYATITTADNSQRLQKTEPIANYNVLVFDKQLKNNSYFSLINTNVTRLGNFRDANVTGTEFRLANKENKYAVNGSGAWSNVFESDATSPTQGYKYFVRVAKVSGKVRFGAFRNVESHTFDPNDLGFIFNNNEISHGANVQYNEFEPKGKLNMYNLSLNVNHQMLYKPNEFTRFFLSSNGFFVFKNFFATGFGANIFPVSSYDYFEPRVQGEKFRRPPALETTAWISTDYRKKFAIDMNVGMNRYLGWDRLAIWHGGQPRIRVNNKFSIFPGYQLIFWQNDRGFADLNGDDIVFGVRDRQRAELNMRVSYLFNNKMSINVRARHFWEWVRYEDYYLLENNGELSDTPYNYDGNRNQNFNVFNIDLVYRWLFAPGSELNLIWKNSALTSEQDLIYNYFDNFSNMLEQDSRNLFSIKVLYYLDYSMVKQQMQR